ncbi:hypothetical protein [Nodularia spumigena]|uniref:hypothetical protein n=1 Tax=Nodularia spumigena TaxID=70799 RepID=UPI00232EFD7E|nr:hypothetical protein [Nodularia spumigena]MDB9344593.1 hypothetical protein [Nodularia spumigena CS-588/06]
MPLFESLTLDQQDSVVGGVAQRNFQGFNPIRESLADTSFISVTNVISILSSFTGIEPDEID